MSRVLLHGYVDFIEDWGRGKADEAEAGIIEAARQSTQGSFRGWERDQQLLEFLYSHRHSTPFEFAGMTIEVQAPLFVFREWHRHRTQSYNEMSARYTPLPDLYHQPDLEDTWQRAHAAQATANRQAGALKLEQALSKDEFADWLKNDAMLQEAFEHHYCRGLAIGIPKEIARNDMPVSHYSRMRATGNLRNWLAFLTLRMDPAAQKEIRLFANAVGDIISVRFPRTWELFACSRSS